MPSKSSSRFVLSLLATASLFVSDCRAQQRPAYVRFETDDQLVFMDGAGVAIRLEKRWECRHALWDPEAVPLDFEGGGYQDFRQDHRKAGDLDSWSCAVHPGRVLYSRAVQEAQRAMNSASDKPGCAPGVPETGRLNWEMLDYSRCYVATDVKAALARFDSRLTERLAELLRAEPDDPDGLRRRAKEDELLRPREGCGRTLRTLHDFAVCEAGAQEGALEKAEAALAEYERRVDELRGAEEISQDQAQSVAADAEAIRELLRRAEREAYGG